jgi:hypothetical protein
MEGDFLGMTEIEKLHTLQGNVLHESVRQTRRRRARSNADAPLSISHRIGIIADAERISNTVIPTRSGSIAKAQ